MRKWKLPNLKWNTKNCGTKNRKRYNIQFRSLGVHGSLPGGSVSVVKRERVVRRAVLNLSSTVLTRKPSASLCLGSYRGLLATSSCISAASARELCTSLRLLVSLLSFSFPFDNFLIFISYIGIFLNLFFHVSFSLDPSDEALDVSLPFLPAAVRVSRSAPGIRVLRATPLGSSRRGRRLLTHHDECWSTVSRPSTLDDWLALLACSRTRKFNLSSISPSLSPRDIRAR